jgi:hypothetical protein
MRKISQIQYKRFGDSFIPYRKTILSLIDDHLYLMQSYKYDLVSAAWCDLKATAYYDENGIIRNGVVHICRGVYTSAYFDALILYEGFSEIQGE